MGNSIENLSVPILEKLIPGGVRYGTCILVEFDSDSLWYATAVIIVAQTLRREIKSDYHAFSNHPDDIRLRLRRIGLEPETLERKGLLWMIDFYSPGIGAKSTERFTAESLQLSQVAMDIEDISLARAVVDEQRRSLHVDENWSPVFMYNEEKSMVQYLRTNIMAGVRRLRLVNLLGITRDTHSQYV